MQKLEKISLIEGDLICVTGLHIGAGDMGMHIGGTDNAVIKTVAEVAEPYIPGSSLKGKMRSLLEKYKGQEYDVDLAKLFGIKSSDNQNDSKVIGTTRLSFWDCFLTDEWKKEAILKNIPLTEVKMENSINRETGVARNPRNTERVISGSVFHFKLSLKRYEGDDLLNLVLAGLKLLEKDALGGSGSRGYGRICFKNLMIDGVSLQSDFDKIKLF